MQGGVRKLIHEYLDAPFDLRKRDLSLPLDDFFGTVLDDRSSVAALKRHAKKAGIPVSEAIRQIVRVYMKNINA